MLLRLRPPPLEACFRLRDAVAGLPLSYSCVGATHGDIAPAGYRWTRAKVRIGSGPDDFAAAREAIRNWRMLPTQIAEVWPAAPRIAVGEVVVVRLRSLGLHALGPCRIVHCIDEQTADAGRFGFAYGTLPGHLASGEEQFLVSHNAADDAVWYELTAFSRPAHWLTHLACPLLRAAQRHFVRRSLDVMQLTLGACHGLAAEAA